MTSGVFPFAASGSVPETSTFFPTKLAAGDASGSGASSSLSFDPVICSLSFPPSCTTWPSTVASDCFIVKPFLAIASFNCFNVALFPAFKVTDARPFSRLTLTVSTPATDFNDTRTACAQTSQSIPKTVMLMERISACAAEAISSNVDITRLIFFINLLVLMLEKQVTEIEGVAHTFFGRQRADIAVDRDFRPKTHGVVPEDSKARRPQEYLVCLSLRKERTVVQERRGTLSHELAEDAPVPLVCFFTPLRRSIAVDQAVIENIRPPFAAAF